MPPKLSSGNRSAPRRGGSSRGGNFRGRGGPNRGGSSRGRGRPSNLGGKRPRFDSSRLEQQKEEDSESSSSQDELPSDDDEESSSGSEDGEDDDAPPSERPYAALLRSFAETSGPQAKRRKLNAQPEKRLAASLDGNPKSRDSSEEADSVSGDLVEEPEAEEAENGGSEGDLVEDDSDDSEVLLDETDPFTAHFARPNESDVARRLKAIKKDEWVNQRVASKTGVRIVVTAPKADDPIPPPTPISGPSELRLKPKLKEAIASQRPEFDAVEQMLAAPLFNYYDTLFCQRTVANGDSLRRLVCLHALNHVVKTRDRVIKNSAKLAREDAADAEVELRDQGFTRPKVLMLLPTRQSCARMVEMICSLAGVDRQENRKRFDESFVDKEPFPGNKPPDFKDLFEGNSDDLFRLGVKFTRKTIKFYAQFYSSDIIFASPLGLRMAIGSDTADDGDGKAKKRKRAMDSDFLSSIELVVVDQADAVLMQNWEHVEFIFDHLNLQPKDAHGCDFTRVRNWYLDGHSRNFRQTVVLSAFNTPELSEVMRSQCVNWAGKVRVQPEYQGVIEQLGLKAKQTFSRFDAASITAEPDARFAYFTRAIVPTLVKRVRDASGDGGHHGGGTLVFIPSYLDFVRVRNYFATSPALESVSFGAISDHSAVAETSRARSHFLTGRHRVLLYTERAHHFWRHQLKGVWRIVMYGLPDNPVFYREMAGDFLARSEQDLTIEPGHGHVRVLFSKYDVLKLERVVGTQRVAKMVNERGDTFDFV